MDEHGQLAADQRDASDTIADRRRSGRLKDVSPELVPLLRNPTQGDFLVHDPEGTSDQLAPARGIILAIKLSGLFWMLVTVAVAIICYR
jgi:hypothetical protein